MRISVSVAKRPKAPTAADIAKFAKDKKSVYQSTFVDYCKAQVGTKYKDFVGRSRTWAIDSMSDVRSAYYFWSACVKNALKFNLDVPAKVKADYTKRDTVHSGENGNDAYKLSGNKRMYP